MSAAKKCDRCGVLYEAYNVEHNPKKTNGMMTLNIDEKGRYFTHTAKDLCPECQRRLMIWLGGDSSGFGNTKISD